ncbi:unnamed protein product [Mytilus coruscus]|uniref:Integrase p58-like C-terminal domain-containing protein n=1 Tax=Mytilus coruscus TaxID=42192 RepID=A0A6J8A719_MYTCO|nr:unnamed protein product [Mytilus coruscus]
MKVLAMQRGRGGFGNRENRFQQSRRQRRGRGYGSYRNLRASEDRPICNYCVKIGHFERNVMKRILLMRRETKSCFLNRREGSRKGNESSLYSENRNFGNSSVATSVLNDVEISTEKSCLAKVISDVVKENEMNPPEVCGNINFRHSSVATSVLNDVVISDIVKENVISCEFNPKFCVAKIRGLVNEKSVLMLIDTGSTVSIVNDCFVDRRDVSEVNNLSDVNYKIQLCDSKKSEQTVHVNRIKQFVDPDDRPIIDGEDIVPNINPIENSDNTMVKILDTMRSRNESKRLETHYFVQYENGETQWVKEDAIKDFAIINDFHISNENND